ncbi:hypothetical protein ACFYR1_53075 [Streptomyces canus]|uniref:hypothetical protein n=1 Tax=Streptomyces canus TaxID=58343 RepID=UPI0036B967F7
MALMYGGATLTEGGAAVCLTGVGCLAGAPAIAAGLSGVAAGAYGTGDGIGRINDGLGKALNEASGESAGSGATAEDLGAQNPDITWETEKWDGWGHVQENQRIGGVGYDAENKSAFIGKGAKVKKWIQQVVKENPANPNTGNGRDGYIYRGRVNTGSSDGVGILSDIQKQGLSTDRAYGIEVVLNRDGSLRTAYPIP